MSKRAILYARVSGDDRTKGGLNLGGQIELCREFARKKDYAIIAELPENDRGVSGATLDRPALRQALEMAYKHEFEVLIVREIDRFARSLASQLSIEQEFKRYGVEVEFALESYSDSPEGSLHKHIKAVIAEYERLKINERTIRGRKLKVKSGSVLVHGKPPYGYRLQEQNGKSTLVVHPREAQVVKLIYQWYAKGDDDFPPLSTRKIAEQLSAIGIPVPSITAGEENTWSARTILQILTNETYAGVWYYGKNAHSNGKRITHPEHKWVPVQITPIVSRELWKEAQKKRGTNLFIAPRNTKYPYLLAKRLICAICGAPLNARSSSRNNHTYYYYTCPKSQNAENEANPCPNKNFYRADWTDHSVWQWLYAYLSDPQIIQAGQEEFAQIQKEEIIQCEKKIALIYGHIEANRQQLQRLVDLYISGQFSKKLLMDQKNKIQAKITKLSLALAKYSEKIKGWENFSERFEDVMRIKSEVVEKLAPELMGNEHKYKLIDLLDVTAALYTNPTGQFAKIRFFLGSKEIAITSINEEKKE